MQNNSSLKEIEAFLFEKTAKIGNFLLIGAVAVVLAMMIIPLPPFLLDALLTVNIVIAITLMVVSVSISDPMKLASFPTLLLLTTLFRLGLNLASTRLVLTEAHAGEIINTFGQMATGGSLLVGCVMFVILTLIQFIIIAKGSERVAEVAARFTLDAMPGKQMSIDADLRAGLISQEEAKDQRDLLHRESKMYGAMDGAMKFVKGDAIAGILITVINICGGLTTGVLIKGMTAAKALQTYSILTIGDGLVSQIPSLLVSLSAGFIVTRVSDQKSNHSLGAEIGGQLISQPKALIASAVLAFLMGLIPGFPTLIFWAMGGILAGWAYRLTKQAEAHMNQAPELEQFVMGDENEMYQPTGLAVPLLLEVGPELFRIFKNDVRWVNALSQMYPQIKNHLSNKLGVVFPDVKLALNQDLATTFRYRIKIYEVPVDEGVVNPHHVSVLSEALKTANEEIEPPEQNSETVHGTPIMLWKIKQQSELNKKLSKQGVKSFGPEEMILRHLGRVLTRHAGDFIGIQEVRQLLTVVETQFPELVREVIPKMMSINKLTEIVKRLVEEGVPVKDFRLILQTLSYAQPETKDPVTLTEQVRVGLKRLITFQHVRQGNRLPVLTLSPDIEEEITRSIQKNGSECYLTLAPERVQLILDTFRNTLSANKLRPSDCVVITNIEIRRYVKKIVEDELPTLAVLSYQELDPKVMLEQVGYVNYEDYAQQSMAG